MAIYSLGYLFLPPIIVIPPPKMLKLIHHLLAMCNDSQFKGYSWKS